jgi:dienelactone hydrolase
MHIALGEAKNDADAASLTEWPHRAMAPRSIKEGRAALVIEARNFGESSLDGYGTSCTEAAKIAILVGRTVIGERVWDAMRILDAVLAHFPSLDERNIVCTGNSGGGTATYYLACLDERIAVAAPSCSVCSYEDSIAAMPHCMCNHIPSIRKYFEMGDLARLIAPRRLIVAAGRTDPIFPIESTFECFDTIKKIYRAAGCEDNCAIVVGDGGHLNYADLIWERIHAMGF